MPRPSNVARHRSAQPLVEYHVRVVVATWVFGCGFEVGFVMMVCRDGWAGARQGKAVQRGGSVIKGKCTSIQGATQTGREVQMRGGRGSTGYMR
jgi:hypothetical protein